MLSALLKNRRIWERPVLDAWSIPHFLFGAILAYAIVQLGVNLWFGLAVSIVLAALWEGFEKLTHLSDAEHSTNAKSDILVAQAGYGLGVWLFLAYHNTGIDTIILVGAIIVFIIVCILGWLSHHWYGKK
jgi:hypothetical protein